MIGTEWTNKLLADNPETHWGSAQFTNEANPAIHKATTGPEVLKQAGACLYAKTSHPALGERRNRPGSGWEATSKNQKERTKDAFGQQRVPRTCYAHKYVGTGPYMTL